MTTPTDHDLNQCLATVAGVKVAQCTENDIIVWACISQKEDKAFDVWTPLTDHYQMSVVKAGLQKEGVSIITQFWYEGQIHQTQLFQKGLDPFDGSDDTDELRAFALAVWAMTKGGEG